MFFYKSLDTSRRFGSPNTNFSWRPEKERYSLLILEYGDCKNEETGKVGNSENLKLAGKWMYMRSISSCPFEIYRRGKY